MKWLESDVDPGRWPHVPRDPPRPDRVPCLVVDGDAVEDVLVDLADAV
ncbi:hypothetical protein [Salinigranum marinum]|nr:hypothetical protein [Salinigranum marinum]